MELTDKCGFVDTLAGKRGSSIMADRGFTIRDILNDEGRPADCITKDPCGACNRTYKKLSYS